jgi:DNA primase
MNLLDLISRDVPLRRTSSKHGGEYSGPCPLCRRGTDRFKVWPVLQRWACLGFKAGRAGCDRSGDAIDYLRQRNGLSYADAQAQLGHTLAVCSVRSKAPQMLSISAPAQLRPPSAVWQARAAAWIEDCEANLAGPQGEGARTWLKRRGLTEVTIRRARLGYNPYDHHNERIDWGLPSSDQECSRSVWLPRGIVIPWFVGGDIWRINVRRPLSPQQTARDQPKYVGPAGFAPALFGADGLTPDKPVVLVEGEIDALTVTQVAGDLVAAVATGSTGGARRARWVAQLALAPLVLVAFDADDNGAGHQAATWWLRLLVNGRRLHPVAGKDVNAMHTMGLDVRTWVQAGL